MTSGLHRISRNKLLGTLIALALATPVVASDSELERAELTLMLRQLDALDRQLQRDANRFSLQTSRYRFDYQRLSDDLARVRSGIQDFLTPRRAQPRDPVPLTGSYRTEHETSP